MNYLKTIRLSKLVILLSVIAILGTSCKKDDSLSSGYEGTWSADRTIVISGLPFKYKDVMTISKSGFTDLMQMYTGTSGNLVDYVKSNGTISISDSTMNVKITEIGISTTNLLGMPTGDITMNKEGSSEFTKIFAQTTQPSSFMSVFTVSGNKMTMKTDTNKDGDYNDSNETNVYTKE